MRKITLNKYSDPSHGWIKIDIEKLKRLGLLNKISSYSYINNNHAYLEEDSDASVLLDRLKELNISYKFNYHYSNTESKLRSYEYYSKDKAMNRYLTNLYNHLIG